MNQRIAITRKQAEKIMKATFPSYTGRKIVIEFTETVRFSDLNWGGGSRNQYASFNTAEESSLLHAPDPWHNPIEGLKVDLPANVLIVRHSIFCGKDTGLTIYAHPSNAPKLLGA